MSLSPSEHLNNRYGHALPPQEQPWNSVLDLLLAHRSVRDFTDRPLPPGTLETLIAAAQSAASSSNLQTWSVVVVEAPERRQRLAELAGNQAHIAKVPLFLVWVADLSRLQRQADDRGTQLQGLPYLDSLILASVDVALAAQNAVVAAESLGLASVYIGALRNDVAAVIDLLQLPAGSYPVFGLCVGYADDSRPTAVKPRLPQSVVVHRDVYSSEREQQAIEAYNDNLKHFYAGQQMPQIAWSDLVIKRMQQVETLHGREKVGGALRAHGFSLE
jgi:nitroreductase